MDVSFTTSEVNKHKRNLFWLDAIKQTYFELDVYFSNPESFSGGLDSCHLGSGMTLSYLRSDPAEYIRLKSHLKYAVDDESFLLTVPTEGNIYFEQMGRQTSCHKGSFVLELSHEPYRFSYPCFTHLWVLKIPHATLKQYLHQPERYCALTFDGIQGLGLLFRQYLNSCHLSEICMLPIEQRWLIGKQLTELFSLAVAKDERLLLSNQSIVRNAHLWRIENYVLQHLGNPDLKLEEVAQACKISVRYLHDLFRCTGSSFGQWLRLKRLQGAHDELCSGKSYQTLAQVAYRWGFVDQAHFSRLFKQSFGYSPKESRRKMN